jgi:hypothetical protein
MSTDNWICDLSIKLDGYIQYYSILDKHIHYSSKRKSQIHKCIDPVELYYPNLSVTSMIVCNDCENFVKTFKKISEYTIKKNILNYYMDWITQSRPPIIKFWIEQYDMEYDNKVKNLYDKIAGG